MQPASAFLGVHGVPALPKIAKHIPFAQRFAGALLFLVLSLTASPLWAVYGLVETRDGQSWVGEIKLEPGALTVQTTNGTTHRVGFETLSRFRPQERPKVVVSSAPPDASQGTNGLLGSYFPTKTFDGQRFERIDPEINFDWKGNPPAPGLGSDQFSVRWTGQIEAPVSGRFTFHAATDDGVRLWIRDQPLIDQWRDQSVTETSADIDLEVGQRYDLKLEYFENNGEAVAKLFWTEPGQSRTIVPRSRLFHAGLAPAPPPPPPAPPSPQGLLGLYFNTQDLTGPFVAVTNPTVNYRWNDQPPLPGINQDRFSVRWLGKIAAAHTEPYTFHAESDDGMRLWVDGVLLIKAWSDGAFNLSTQPVAFEKGRTYDIQFEMYDATSTAMARLSWSSPSQPRAIIPAQHLIPVPVPKPEPGSQNQPAGLLLTGGSFIARRIHEADSSQIRFSTSAPPLSAIHVSRINFHPLPPDKASVLQPDRTGLLLQSGDFFDGEIRGVRDGKVMVHSVLFGLKRFGMDAALAAILRDPQPKTAAFEIRTRDQSTFLADRPRFDQNSLGFQDPPLAGFKILPEDLLEIRRTPSQDRE